MRIIRLSTKDFKVHLEQDKLRSEIDSFKLAEKVIIDSDFVNWQFREITLKF